MTRRTVLALAVLTMAGCIDTPRTEPLQRQTTLFKRIGGAAGVERLVDAYSDELLLASDVSRSRKELLVGSDRATTRQRLIRQTTALTGGPVDDPEGVRDGRVLPLNPDAPDYQAARDAFLRAVKACEFPDRDRDDLVKAVSPPA